MRLISKYKIIPRLNENIWKNKGKLLSFNKKKWEKLRQNSKYEYFLNTKFSWFKLNQSQINMKKYYSQNLPLDNVIWKDKKYNYLKKSNIRFFKMQFIDILKFRLKHGLLDINNYSKLISASKKNKKPALFQDSLKFNALHRLNYSLWSINIIQNLFDIKHLISYNNIYINGQLVNINNYMIKDTDIISLNYSNVLLDKLDAYLYSTHNYLYYRYIDSIIDFPNNASLNKSLLFNILVKNNKQKFLNKFNVNKHKLLGSKND